MCAEFGTIVMANNDLARGGGDLWITLYSNASPLEHSASTARTHVSMAWDHIMSGGQDNVCGNQELSGPLLGEEG